MKINFSADDKQVNKAISNLIKKCKGDARQAVKETCLDMVTDAHKIVAVDTGRLKTSIIEHVTGDPHTIKYFDGKKVTDIKPKGNIDKGVIVGQVGTNVKYAKFVEFGTVKMKARPYLLPAYYKNRGNLIKKLAFLINSKKGL